MNENPKRSRTSLLNSWLAVGTLSALAACSGSDPGAADEDPDQTITENGEDGTVVPSGGDTGTTPGTTSGGAPGSDPNQGSGGSPDGLPHDGSGSGGTSSAGGSSDSGGASSSGGTASSGGAPSSGGTASSGGAPSSGGVSGSGGSPSTSRCDAGGLTWKSARKTNYTSYPDPGSEECVKYNGCTWAGWFAGCDNKQTESWVESHNIAAVFPGFNSLAGHEICIKSGDKEMIVHVVDTCGDSDCDGCCTQNQGANDALVDLESYTNARWGLADGIIQWADLGKAAVDICE